MFVCSLPLSEIFILQSLYMRPNKALQRISRFASIEIVANLNAGFVSIALPIYRCGAAERQAVRRRNHARQTGGQIYAIH